jgi:hypothetical protein
MICSVFQRLRRAGEHGKASGKERLVKMKADSKECRENNKKEDNYYQKDAD